MTRSDHIVYVVDDDSAIRDAVDDLLCSFGFRVVTFGCAADYVCAPKAAVPTCLILDLQLPDCNGLDLQGQLAGADRPPIVFISGHGTVSSSVRAMKDGAFDFLPKPFSKEALVTVVEAALARDAANRRAAAVRDSLRARYAALTTRERETLPLVVSGLLNKQAAARLGISVVTLQIHRGSIMRKMAARSLADLVRMAGALDVPIDDERSEAAAARPAKSSMAERVVLGRATVTPHGP